ncbi:hypothetical protein BOX15_Mlig013490g1 [Macrostomum lignano]|uniref:Cytoplasmic dynein 2 heavy chain 1 n=2 Tax=Macrostomum lignano TaxID=282301 RepID=A0A1I8GFW0_9PLAT|nr:hypothetical protein BOX15_Mlig013490g1 [Macrostomum lignano]
MAADSRKQFILGNVALYFSTSVDKLSDLNSSSPLDEFLDDGKVSLLIASEYGGRITLSNKPQDQQKQKNSVAFMKLRPDPITPDNLHSDILVSSMTESPLSCLYHSIQKLYAPMLLEGSTTTEKLDPKLQTLLTDLESGIAIALRKDSSSKSKDDSKNFAHILSPSDEFHYWAEEASRARGDAKDRAAVFHNIFKSVSGEYSGLSELTIADALDLVDATQDILDELWKQSETTPYPESRMRHLMEITGNEIVRYLQNRLSSLALWTETYSVVKDSLDLAVQVCDRWLRACEQLTGQFWKRYAPNPWKGSVQRLTYLEKFKQRLEEVLAARTVHEQMCRLLTDSEKVDARLGEEAFESLQKVQPLNFNPYTEPLWRAAVSKFESHLAPAEARVVGKLRGQLRQCEGRPQQLLKEFQRYKELVRRPTIGNELLAEREQLLGQLTLHAKQLRDEFVQRTQGSGRALPSKNVPDQANRILWTRQLELRMKEITDVGHSLLGDLGGFKAFSQTASTFLEELQNWRRDAFDDWASEMQSLIDDPNKPMSLETQGQLMELRQSDGKLHVNYSERLVTLLREVRTLNSLGYEIPKKIQRVHDVASKFYRHAIVLKQVAHFYNTIDAQMIHSQKPMMLEPAMKFERLVKSPKPGSKQKGSGGVQVTWDSPEELEAYIRVLQEAANDIMGINRKLRKQHHVISEKVVDLMGIDLLRQQHRWKEGLQEIRLIMTSIAAQGVSPDNMLPWRAHWDRQLYKALEHQYRLGLEALNENLPEIRVDLTIKQGRLVFKPPFEEIKAKYYREMKKFVNIPNVFKGVSESSEGLIYPSIIERNAEAFNNCFVKACFLFKRLEALLTRFKDWVVLGGLDLDAFVEQNCLELAEYEKNVKALKVKGRDAEKLPNEIRIDCVTVNCQPMKNSIDTLINNLFDSLLNALRLSIKRDADECDAFLTRAMETLGKRPQTVDEISEAGSNHAQFGKERPQQKGLLESAEVKNRLLRGVAGGGVEFLAPLNAKWETFEIMMESFQMMILEQIEMMKTNVESRIKAYVQDLEKFSARWNQLKPGRDILDDGDQERCLAAIKVIKEKKEEFSELEKTRESLTSDCEHFQMERPEFPLAEELKADLDTVELEWGQFEKFNSGLQDLAKEDWISFRSRYYVFEEFLGQWFDRLREEEPTSMTVRLQKEIDKYKDVLPVLKWVRGEPLGPDHWLDLFRLIHLPRGTTLERLTFGNLLSVSSEIIANAEALKELNLRAQGEVSIREAIRELELWGAGAQFQLTDYEDSHNRKVSLIKDWKDLVSQVGDNQCILQSLKDSPYYKSFADKATLWETRLADLDEYLQNLNLIQRKWVYLEPIFGRGALPKEQPRFKRVDDDFRAILQDIARDSRVLSLCNQSGLRNNLTTMLDQLQRCQKALNEFLEAKRSIFPRFYFIGDDDLLEILGQSTNPTVIKTHLKKLFQGIHDVEFDQDAKHIVAIKSLDGEIVPLRREILVTAEVESWLSKLADEMKATLRELLVNCLEDMKSARHGALDPSAYPSQVLCLAEMITFTSRAESTLKSGSLSNLRSELEKQLDAYTRSDMGQSGEEAAILELKLKALILDMIHNIDVVDQLMAHNTRRQEDWMWQKQLRFYLKPSDKCCEIRMVDAVFEYTYEYQGNAPKLVHTPLTDKCYLTMTQGMFMGLGANPYGPAGTGKTESVKALGSLFGRQVLVFNCDEGIDVQSMGRIFIGLVKSGAWGCFDEFNRLEEAVLSAVSMQIQVIQDGIKNRLPKIELLGRTIDVDPNSGIFITLNPAGKGYGGRQKLPDNLKQLFRPVAMSRPDNEQIAEVILFSEGFRSGKELGRKLVAIFNLSKELLTQQQHYDWGLRALKTVLRSAGGLVKTAKKALKENEKLEPDAEARLVVQALRINTLSKLTFSDCFRFDSLVKDVFPTVDFKDIEYQVLAEKIREVVAEQKLVLNENQVKKCLEVYEQTSQRMGVVIVGPSGSGKSTLWKVLRQAMIKTGKMVKQYVMNPKAMPRTQLLGSIDLDTREWSDGVLTFAARQVVKEPQEVQSWIVCDGDIDPEWVESLNSVLDDNRLLTMPNGERIQFGPNVNFLFETHDLSCASPATISRMGMIFLSDEATDIRAVVQSWLSDQPEKDRELLSAYIEDYFYSAVDWVLKTNDYCVDTTLVGTVLNGLSHLKGVQNKAHFAISLIRGLGGNLPEATREKFATEVFAITSESPPDSKRPLDCFFDSEFGRLQSYSNMMDTDFSPSSIISTKPPVILTSAIQRNLDCFKDWLQAETRQPFIITGPDGCGKGMLLQYCFDQVRSLQVAVLHCSAQTTPTHILQKLGQCCMVISSNTGRVYRPKDCERLVLYLKDVNLPKPDKWGTSQLVAFLQQVLTYNGFYDSNLEFVGLEGVQIVCSMNASTTVGRHKLSTRFTSVVRICSMGYPDKEQLQTIYSSYLKVIFDKIVPRHPVWSSSSKMHALASTMVSIFDSVRGRFSPDERSHYLFTPRDLTRWVRNLLRYDLPALESAEQMMEVVAYEAFRLFRDRLVDSDARGRFDNLLGSIIRSDWSSDAIDQLQSSWFVTWGSREPQAAGAPPPPQGKTLGKLSFEDLSAVVDKGLLQYSRENKDLEIVIFKEVLDHVARADRVLCQPGGSLLMAGKSGVGRRSTALLVAHMHLMTVMTPKIARGYTVKQFKTELKAAIQKAGIDGEQVLFLLEDFQLLELQFLEMINSLLSSGEVPGLYTPEELEPLLTPLRDLASESGFRGPLANFLASRVQANLHIVLIMDFDHPNFTIRCESNPALFKQCAVQWLSDWSRESMVRVAHLLLTRVAREEGSKLRKEEPKQRHLSGGESLLKLFLHVHESVPAVSATPRRYINLLNTYKSLYSGKKSKIQEKKEHLKAGVSKLNEAKDLVDELKRKAADQQVLLTEKQTEADEALKEITQAMSDAGEQRAEMEKLSEQTAEENKLLQKRNAEIDLELKDVMPLVEEAKKAVGSIKTESLSEIRSLRAPPDTIRDILEGVLTLMGNLDTSWQSMKNFLARRGVTEEIKTFEARKITPELRSKVEDLLRRNKASFDPVNAKRASVAAAPLAEWTKANVQYSHVLQRIQPLESEQAKLKKNLDKSEARRTQLKNALAEVDNKVAGLKDKFQKFSTDAAKLKVDLDKANETIQAAENLVSKLDGEHQRWNQQMQSMDSELDELPVRSLLAAAFICYMPAAPEDQRLSQVKTWLSATEISDHFDLRRFLTSESEQLIWKSEGLPSDDLSVENGIVILQCSLRPFLIDPSSRATDWLKTHLKDQKLEAINQQDANFTTSLELAVRFGKTLIIQEVDGVEPVLYPLLRSELIAQGPRFVVQLGEKVIDYNPEFRLFLTTRNPNPDLPPDAAAIVTTVNFTTTRAGLTGQLLAATIQHEKPELEVKKSELLKQEEDLKIKLAELEESLLEELAKAKGNILENKELLESLNQTKASSTTIQESLSESVRLQVSLDEERSAFLPLAEDGSKLYFVICDLAKINNMYRFSLSAFLSLFHRALASEGESPTPSMRIQALLTRLKHLVYEYVCRSLFKADRLMFALHMSRGMRPDLFREQEWEAFAGLIVSDAHAGTVPGWISEERRRDVQSLMQSLPELSQELRFEDANLWRDFSRSSECENAFPLEKRLSAFQKVLAIQALRPDRLFTALNQFAMAALDLNEISPPNVNLKVLFEKETSATEPVLVLISAGSDPSQELQELAGQTIGSENYHQVAMGQGQSEIALKLLRDCSREGDWLCLKNLHLVTSWLPVLEKELNQLRPHAQFRLWLTAEPHPKFPPILLQTSLKVTYEAPPGVKRNLSRTYETWTPQFMSLQGSVVRSCTLFALAWFHAVLQERRNFIPQGWTKFYEFSNADLRAGADIIDRLVKKHQDAIPWEFVYGLFENAIYGGRVDNVFDLRVLKSYLHQCFDPNNLTKGNRRLGPIKVPGTTNHREFVDAVATLPEFDNPSYFGLPENIDRSSQRILSSQVIGQLRVLQRVDVKGVKFDKDLWAQELSPILNLWKKLNQGHQLIQAKANPPSHSDSANPIKTFVLLERFNAIKLVQYVHSSLASLSKVIRGSQLLTSDIQKLAEALLLGETPLNWLSRWDGPEDPLLYLHGLVGRAVALDTWLDKVMNENLLNSPLDLSELFKPDTFLNALRQQTARQAGCSMDSLKFACSWGRGGIGQAKLTAQLVGFQLEGCTFDGNQLTENSRDSPSVSAVPAVTIAWIAKTSSDVYSPDQCISLPVYYDQNRDRVVARLDLPCNSGTQDQWIQCGAALFLKPQ